MMVVVFLNVTGAQRVAGAGIGRVQRGLAEVGKEALETKRHAVGNGVLDAATRGITGLGLARVPVEIFVALSSTWT